MPAATARPSGLLLLPLLQSRGGAGGRLQLVLEGYGHVLDEHVGREEGAERPHGGPALAVEREAHGALVRVRLAANSTERRRIAARVGGKVSDLQKNNYVISIANRAL